MIIESSRNLVVENTRFDRSLDEVEEFLARTGGVKKGSTAAPSRLPRNSAATYEAQDERRRICARIVR